MMTFSQILKNRKSIRAYASTPVRPEDIAAMGEAARLSPSACNSQTWRFIAVTDREMILRIGREAMLPVIPNKWLIQAPLVMVGCSRLDLLSNRIGSRVTGIDYYQIDLGIAMEHMVLKATELGLGSCWIGWFSEQKVKSLLSVPKNVRVSALLTIGYPKETAAGNHVRKSLDKILFAEKWGNPLSTPTRS